VPYLLELSKMSSVYMSNNRGRRLPLGVELYNRNFDHEISQSLVVGNRQEAPHKKLRQAGCVFAKSCSLPDGVINYYHPGNFVPLELLKSYGEWAVLVTETSISATGTPLKLAGGSSSSITLSARLGGNIALGLTDEMVTAGCMGGTAHGTIAVLLPNNTLSPDSAYYTQEQYAAIDMGRTRVRLNIRRSPEGAVDVYGFYTGGKPKWESVPIIKAAPRGDQFTANIARGIELIWTPAADPNEVPRIPTLEGAHKLPAVWVYPPTERSEQILVNPVYPPEYQDAIIWFPSGDIQPIYIALSLHFDSDAVTV
jgi:hypothetical protein